MNDRGAAAEGEGKEVLKMQRLKPLRICKICGLEAYTELDLEKFKKDNKRYLFGREPLCKSCENARFLKGGKYWRVRKRGHENDDPRRIEFLGKRIRLEENPRTNICSECGRKYPEELKRQTVLHHTTYDSTNPLLHTIELCASCHVKRHGLGITTGIGRTLRREAEKE